MAFAAQLERQRRAGGVQALGGDRHADREVLGCVGIAQEVAAAFVAAPVQQHLARAHAAHEHGAVLAVAGRQHVAAAHRRADADVGGFVPQAGSVGAELAGALQRHGFAVEGAHVEHLLEQRQQGLRVGRIGREGVADRLAVRVEVLQVFDFELGGDGHDSGTLDNKFQMI